MDCDGITMEAGDWLGGCRWGQWQRWQETTWWSKARLSHLKWFLRDNCTVITFHSNPETQQLLVRKKKKCLCWNNSNYRATSLHAFLAKSRLSWQLLQVSNLLSPSAVTLWDAWDPQSLCHLLYSPHSQGGTRSLPTHYCTVSEVEGSEIFGNVSHVTNYLITLTWLRYSFIILEEYIYSFFCPFMH